jgi:hypothetical protein
VPRRCSKVVGACHERNQAFTRERTKPRAKPKDRDPNGETWADFGFVRRPRLLPAEVTVPGIIIRVP